MLTNGGKSAPELGPVITVSSSLTSAYRTGFFLQPIIVRAEINLAGLRQDAGLTGQGEHIGLERSKNIVGPALST